MGKRKIEGRRKEVNEMDFKKRSEKLKEMIDKLQCHGCKKVPAPNDLNRYPCGQSHYLCEDCRGDCNCGSRIGVNVPSGIFKLLLESSNLPWYCQNYPKGCREILEKENLKDHQDECIFRPVNCPHLHCEKKGEIAFKDIIDHVYDSDEHTELKILVTEDEINTKFGRFILSLKEAETEEDGLWNPKRLIFSKNVEFFVEAITENRSFYVWIYIADSPYNANNYDCTIFIENGKKKITVEGLRVYPLDVHSDDTINGDECFSVKCSVAAQFCDQDGDLDVEIKIRNLKEEAKDDDDESGLEDSN